MKPTPPLPILMRARRLIAASFNIMLATAALAQTPQFTPGHLAVLQEGDGGTNRGFYAASDLFGSRQNPLFVSQFDPNGVNQTNPTYQVAIPTNGAGAMLINGNAGTDGNLHYNSNTGFDPIQFQNIALTSCAKVINDTLYASVKGSESVNLYPAGIYSFVDFFNNPAPYPNAASFLHLVVPAAVPYTNCI